MDHATFVNAPRTVDILGREFQVSALTLKEWGPVQGHIKAHVPGPMKSINSADLEGLDEQDRRVVLEIAMIGQRNWPPRIGSQSWFLALDTPDGTAAFLTAALRKHQPALSDAEIRALSDVAETKDIIPTVAACLGLDIPEDKPQTKKAESGDEPTTRARPKNPPTSRAKTRTSSRGRSAGPTSKSSG